MVRHDEEIERRLELNPRLGVGINDRKPFGPAVRGVRIGRTMAGRLGMRREAGVDVRIAPQEPIGLPSDDGGIRGRRSFAAE